jgi:hypothetical protein
MYGKADSKSNKLPGCNSCSPQNLMQLIILIAFYLFLSVVPDRWLVAIIQQAKMIMEAKRYFM